MITLAQIRDWLKTQIECPQWYIGKIDGGKPLCIGLYNVPGPPPRIALGGLENTSYATKAVSVLIHWGTNADVAERKAQDVYKVLFSQTAVIGGHRVIQFQMRQSEPVSVGTDEKNVYEYVVDTTIFYEREVM